MFEDADLISVYTRAQAIADGTLIDLTNATDRDGRKLSPFKWPVAMTQAAFAETISAGGKWVAGPPGDDYENLVLPGCQDFAGRVWDVLWMLVVAIRRSADGADCVRFEVSVLVDGERDRRTVQLKSLCGPGDDGEPVLTIMLPNED
jgi:Family of unknown function (DUF6573)